jgi:hypothetical protein
MMKRLLLPVLVLGLGVGLLTALSSPAAESAAATEKISKLIEQMGSNEFDDREDAQKQLDAIGEPALEALKKAMSNEDTEIRRRAEGLVKAIEQRTESTKVLQATKIHLVYKDTPLPEALADFRKKSGFNITLHDPDGKLKDRKITLDTGETVFWTAFDKFCAAANLVEAKQEDLVPQVQPGQPGGPGNVPNPPPVQIQPVPPIRKLPAQPVQPQAQQKVQQLGAVEAPVADEVPQKVAQQPATKPAVQPQPPVQVKPVPPINVGPNPNPQQPVQLQPGQIVLKDGKPKDAPTDYSSSIRVRAMEKSENVGAPEIGQVVVGLQVSPEPKITWQNLIEVTITKAVDDKDQTLAQAAVETPNAPGFGVGGPGGGIRVVPLGQGWNAVTPSLHQEIPVYLKKGEKKTKSLKELTGVIKAQVLTPAKAVITTDDVFKSANKTFQGGDKGSIKIIEATKADNGQVRVKFEMQAPLDVVPANNGVGGPLNGPWGAPGAGGGFGGPALPQGKLQVQVQVQVQAQPAIMAIRPGRPIQQQIGTGLQAIDDKGNVIPMQIQQQWVVDQNVQRLETTAIFQLTKEQTVAKLVYSGSRAVTVEVPFTLKDVTLP